MRLGRQPANDQHQADQKWAAIAVVIQDISPDSAGGAAVVNSMIQRRMQNNANPPPRDAGGQPKRYQMREKESRKRGKC